MKEYDLYFNKFNKNKKFNSQIDKNAKKIMITNNNYYSYKSNNDEPENQNKKNISQDLLDNHFNLNEKYNYITMLALNDNKDQVQLECKEILFKIDFNNRCNPIIISDILGIISKYNLTKIIPDLQKLLELKKDEINSNIFLFREFNSTIKYLEQVKSGKINIITKINVYININKDNNSSNNSKGVGKNSIILKRPGTNSETKIFKRGGDEINFKKSMRNKLLSNTSNKKMNSSSNKNNSVNLAKKFSSEMKKLQEKNIQESINSVDFELDETIKNN